MSYTDKSNFDRFLSWRKIWTTNNNMWLLWDRDTNLTRFKRHAIREMMVYLVKSDREVNNERLDRI